MTRSPHTFHIPVMGTGFTIDTPLKVARYGISSVISLVDDQLIEQMREYHCLREGEPYKAVPEGAKDARALRITLYLNLISRALKRQVNALQSSPFAQGSEISRYFEMLPDCDLRREYERMRDLRDPVLKMRLQERLRPLAVPGRVDVNIMTKLDRLNPALPESEAVESTDALSALRGYAQSELESSVVFSAGLNPRLYSYAAKFADFFPSDGRPPKKSIVLKVSDFRSAEIQGKYLAKRGLWVAEYRIESGLNCGGHAFATDGLLLGPILEEFRLRRAELAAKLSAVYAAALATRGLSPAPEDPPFRVTVQGGIGTAEEDWFLRDRFGVDGTGWGTPFLLVPEASNVDDAHLRKLCEAGERDVYLSNSSPLGVPFWNLRNSASEETRRERVRAGRPGSLCRKGFLTFNTEYSQKPLCVASRAYQSLKIKELASEGWPPEALSALEQGVVAKACICDDLAGGATVKLGIQPDAATAVCPGPNIVNFSKVASLREMVDHIYGRISLMTNPLRKHMFVQELRLYVDYYKNKMAKCSAKERDEFEAQTSFLRNLMEGIRFYRELARELDDEIRASFLRDLEALGMELAALKEA